MIVLVVGLLACDLLLCAALIKVSVREERWRKAEEERKKEAARKRGERDKLLEESNLEL